MLTQIFFLEILIFNLGQGTLRVHEAATQLNV